MIIYKHIFRSSDGHYNNIIPLPVSGKILSAKVQNDDIVIYYSFDSTNDVREVFIDSVLTWQRCENMENMTYLDTVVLYDGSFVVHIYYDNTTLSR